METCKLMLVFLLIAASVVFFCFSYRNQSSFLVELLSITGITRSSSASSHCHIELTDWFFNGTLNNTAYSGPAIAPGDIYLDLQRNGFISDPLIGDNDKALRWVGRTDWTYETIVVSPELLKRKAILLNIRGLDTVATVKISDTVVARTVNQFDEQIVDITNLLLEKQLNTFNITIDFRSPVHYVREQSNAYKKEYSHDIPPDCPPEVFSGECHANFIRKVQSSFSWDWGPSFPTVGIWQPISIEAFDFAYFTQVTAQTLKNGDHFVVLVELSIYSAISSDSINGAVSFHDLSISKLFTTTLKAGQINEVTVNVTVPLAAVELWWPNGHGKSTLYALNVAITDEAGECVVSNKIKIGFRTIELVQDHIDANSPDKGRYFYFKVNDVPIFLKGSNWIPLSSFPGRVDDDRIDFLLHSTVEANMNALRVWGGGRYESDHFYEMADELGILIWQDMMFACAEYPTDPKFIENVEREFTVQVNRLKHHASVLVWSGNNENEVAVVSSWWWIQNYSKNEEIADYKLLYMDTMKPLIEKLDQSRHNYRAGSVARNPGDGRYGDIHAYVEDGNLWSDESWQIARCASEYGIQSLPNSRTLKRALPDTTPLTFTSQQMENRQHHPGGTSTFINMIFARFPAPTECGKESPLSCQYVRNSPDYLDRFIYYTQVHQAFVYQAETEHYIRWRSRLNDQGWGWTMCALYWQLNDIWAAPTWSSIDFDLNWKPVHYMARRFFAPILISTYVDAQDLLHVFVVSDESNPIRATLTYEIFDCKQTCTSLVGELRFNVYIKPYSSVEVVSAKKLRSLVVANHSSQNFHYEDGVDRCRLFDSSGAEIAMENIRVGKNLIKAGGSQYGNVHINTVKGLSDREYEIDLVASGFAPLIWLDLTESRPGWFSDNLFTMLGDGNRTITFSLFKSPNRTLTIEDFTICSLSDCGNKKGNSSV